MQWPAAPAVTRLVRPQLCRDEGIDVHLGQAALVLPEQAGRDTQAV